MQMPEHDPYEVLGIPSTAQTAQIRTAYKKLALKFHPDKIQDESLREKGTVEFRKIQEAYEFISDESKRAQYDQKKRAEAAAKERMPARGAPGTSSRRGNCVFEDITPREYSTGPKYEPRPPPSKSYRAPRDPSPVSVDRQRPSRYSDDDYEEQRSRSRKHADYERRHHHSKTRDPYEKKSSSSSSNSKDYARHETTRHSRERAKETRESTRSSRASNAKFRDKERRRDTSEKYSRTTYYATVEEYTDETSSESSSDTDDFSDREYTHPIREHRRPSEKPRPKLRRREANYSSSWESPKMAADIEGACEYMRTKAGLHKGPTPHESKPSVVYITPLGMHREKDTARRSSARPRMPERSQRDPIDVFDSSSRLHSSHNIPTRGTFSSSRPIPSLRRAGTVPVASFDTSHVEPIVPRSVKKKGTLFDSGYNSPANSPPIIPSGDFIRPSSRQPKIITPNFGTGSSNVGSSYRRAQSTSPLHRDPITIQPTSNTRSIPSDMFQELKPSYYQVFPSQVRYSPRIGADDISFNGPPKRPSVFRKTSVVS
ncbi:hypothetical protein MaudCBS49596_004107 [Microsporum audouinii]